MPYCQQTGVLHVRSHPCVCYGFRVDDPGVVSGHPRQLVRDEKSSVGGLKQPEKA